MICIILKEIVRGSKELRHKYKVPSVLFFFILYQLLSVFIQFGKDAEKNNTLKQALENIEIDLYFYKE